MKSLFPFVILLIGMSCLQAQQTQLDIVGDKLRLTSPNDANRFIQFRIDGSDADIDATDFLWINSNGVRISGMDTILNGQANVVLRPDGVIALRKYEIGDIAQGGIVFWVDETGEHGLAADTVDLGSGIRWYAGTDGNTQAKGDGPFAGEMNTAIIISAQVAIGDDGSTYAARRCAELQKGGYGDWYLPSKEELNLMYANLQLTGLEGFAFSFYYSSTEYDSERAWGQGFGDGVQSAVSKSSGIVRVRAVRAF